MTVHPEILEDLKIPPWSGGYWASRFAGTCGGLLMDLLCEAGATGLASQWLVPFRPTSWALDQPVSSFAALGADCGLPVYDIEDPYVNTRARLLAKWDFWTGSPKTGLASEVGAATGGTPSVLVPNDLGAIFDLITDYWSRFWVRFADGDHPVTGDAATVGAGVTVGLTRLGAAGLTADYTSLVTSVVRRNKPAQWVEWDREFIVGQQLYRSMVKRRIDTSFIEKERVPLNHLLTGDSLWLAPHRDVGTSGSAVTSWTDQIPTEVTFGQSTPAQRPAYDSSGTFLTFDGTDVLDATAAGAKLAPTNKYYFAAAVRLTTLGTSDYLWFHDDLFYVLFSSVVGGLQVGLFSAPSTSVVRNYSFSTTSSWVVLECVYDGEQGTPEDRLETAIDGTPLTPIAPSGTLPSTLSDTPASTVSIGDATNGLDGDVGDILTDIVLPSSANRAAIRSIIAL